MTPDPDSGGTGFFGRARSHPGRAALVAGEVTVSYGQLATRAAELSAGLRRTGLRPGDALVLVARNDPAYFVLVLAAQLSGIRLVPLSSQSTASEISYVVGDCSAAAVVADDTAIEALGGTILPCRRYGVGADRDGWPNYFSALRDTAAVPPPDAVVLTGGLLPYTSGTTGRPKGVLRPLREQRVDRIGAAQADARSRIFDLPTGHGVHLVCSPLHHNAPGTFAQVALHLGHTVVVRQRFDADAVLSDVADHGVTWTHMVPAHFQRLLALPRERREQADTSSLTHVLHAGAPCPPSVKRRMIEWLGPIVWEYYGATEGLVSVLSPADWRRRPGTVGRPAPGIRVSVLDDNGHDTDPDTVGQIWFSVEVSYRYLGDEAKTTAGRRAGSVTVGDLGSLDADGYLTLHDRRTDLIITGGVNVYPAEIEEALAGHPWVADSAVVGVASERWGQEVVAVVELSASAGDPITAEADIATFLSRALSAYKRPKRLVTVHGLPRLESGKLSRSAVREWLLEQLAAPARE